MRGGDTLDGIARRWRVGGGWRALYEANRSAVGPRPDRLRVGLLLTLPSAPPAPANPAPVPAGPPAVPVPAAVPPVPAAPAGPAPVPAASAPAGPAPGPAPVGPSGVPLPPTPAPVR
ncbi:LysM peptidoglycan-binding domain-containing protein [Streptomyces sp. NBC_00091]|nr:LysM peptidoglycan-binding domain-containing protein [Streptomyces sp. NBC_00091]